MKFNTNNTIKAITTLSFMVVSVVTFAQNGENLVNNSGFESTSKKVKRLGKIENATGWVSPTGVRADLFVPSKIEEINVPNNIYGTEEAKEGGNYAGIIAFSYGNKVPRSYVSSKMDAPMKKGMRYCVKFNVSLAEGSKYASNNVGVKFSKKQFGTDGKVSIIEEPSLMHFNNELEVISARYNWTEICGVYEARGGEKYITLGNFLSDEETKSERMKKVKGVKAQQIVAAYYYLDDISVRLLDDNETCDCAIEQSGEEYSKMIYQQVFNITEEMSDEEKIETHQVYFAFGRDKMNTEGEHSLDLIAELMKANPSYKLQIEGHSNAEEDSVGISNDYYSNMDGKRVMAVTKYLKGKGIEEGRLIATMKGSRVSNPEIKEEDDTELRQAKDRRVTFTVRK